MREAITLSHSTVLNPSYRLRGHRDQITALAFVSAPNIGQADEPSTSAAAASLIPQNHLLSTSKDTLLKLWELPTQHCIATAVAHRTQVWTLAVFEDESTGKVVAITGGGEGEAKAWTIDSDVLAGRSSQSTVGDDGQPLRAITPLVSGLLPLATLSHAQRIAQVAYHPTENILAVQTTERTIEVLRIRTEEEIKKKAARRRKREKEKKEKKGLANGDEEVVSEPTWKDRLASWVTIRASSKIRSIDFGIGNPNLKGETTIMAALATNALEVYQLPPKPTKSKKNADEDAETKEATRLHAVELPGHRTDIRTLSLSSDDALLASGSNGSLKIWNVKTTKCLRTMECGYSICSAFLPGDRHIVVGTKTGELYLYDVGSSTLLETFKAHSSEVWSVAVRPDGKGLVSGGADKDVKFWDFEIKDVVINADEDDAPPVRRLAESPVPADADNVVRPTGRPCL